VAVATDPSIDADNLPTGVTLVLMALQGAVFILAAVITVRLVFGGGLREHLGLRPVKHVWGAVGWAAAVYVGFWIATIALVALFGSPEEQGLVGDIRAEQSVLALVASAFLICILAPVAEELFFRGFMFNVLAPRLGGAWASLIVGGVFALGHAPDAPVQSVIALGAFGVGLCVLYWRTQSIIPCMALHALNNSITFGVVTEPHPALAAGVVVACVGAVTAGAAAVSSRVAG
jgi:membrane protease YdiL (CAAX protease family)